MKHFIYTLSILLIITSCSKIANKTKEGVNRSGEAVGETATEFFEGVSGGVEKTLECEISVSKNLLDSGIKTGAYDIEDTSGKNNTLILYIIFAKDFKNTITVKAFNKKGLEIGRTKIEISGNKGDADYYEFVFDERTDIGFKNKITLE